jgi:hypothetical protein
MADQGIEEGAVPPPSQSPSQSPSGGGRKMMDHYAASRVAGQEKIYIEWKDINFSLLQKDPKQSKFMKPVFTEKVILKNINGSARSGERPHHPTADDRTRPLACALR